MCQPGLLPYRTSLGSWSAILSICFGAAVFLSTGADTGAAQTDGPETSPESLTRSLIDLDARYQRAEAAAKPSILAELESVAASRSRVLAALMEQDPAEFLRVALPAGTRRRLSARVRNLVEEEVEMDGELLILHEDRLQGSRYLYFLQSSGRQFSLHFAHHPPTNLLTGAFIRVRGVRLHSAVAVESERAR